MTSPFKSTLSVAARRRQRPAVERSGFVVASTGRTRVALAVEQVERVVRITGDVGADAPSGSMRHRGCPLRMYGLATLLGGAESPATARSRVLIVHAAERGEMLAVGVDEVHEVFAVDTAMVQPIDANSQPPLPHAAVCGWFRQDDRAVWVVDTTRLRVPV